MDISAPRNSGNLLVVAALALAITGAALSAVTWRNLQEQRALIDQHVLFAARTLQRGMESNLVRVMPMLGRLAPDVARQRLEELFRETAASGDVLFLGVYGQQGELLLSSAPAQERATLSAPLDGSALADLALTGEWFGTLPLGGLTMLGYAARMRPGLAQMCPGMPHGVAPGQLPPVYFLVGLSLDEHYAHYVNFRNAALAQTGFVLAVTALLWFLLMAYVRRREQGAKLVRLESFHSKLLDSLPEALLTLDASGAVTSANPAAKELLGVDVVGKPFSSLPLAGHGGQPENAAPREACGSTWREIELDARTLEVLSVPLEQETMVLARDRTRMRSLERDLEQARHLAAVGRLAAGVAHEIRNPLSSLRGFAQFFASKLKGKKPEQSYAETMVHEADRLGRVVTDLLYLARPRAMHVQPVDLAALGEELAKLLHFDFENAKATLRLDMAAPEVAADADGLKQALLNLMLNSLAALPPQGGEVSLTSSAREGRVSICVSDTGRGMSQAERQRALEPFFTTRKEGSGLGLAIVHKIIRDHGGELDIVSSPGSGTTVTLAFRA